MVKWDRKAAAVTASTLGVLALGGGIAAAVTTTGDEGRAPTATRAHVVPAGARDVGFPPYWGRTAPAWCLEDMPCWIGSTADGRSDAAAYSDWSHVMVDESLSWVPSGG